MGENRSTVALIIELNIAVPFSSLLATEALTEEEPFNRWGVVFLSMGELVNFILIQLCFDRIIYLFAFSYHHFSCL